MHIGIYSQMNPDLLSGNSIQNSYLVHEASGPFARNPIPSREGGAKESEGERASERERRDREREIGVEQFRSPTVRVSGIQYSLGNSRAWYLFVWSIQVLLIQNRSSMEGVGEF